MYAFDYNRQKFANLAKCDEKLSIPSTSKAIKRPLPVPPPVPPTPPAKITDNLYEDIKVDRQEQTVTSSNGERKKRKTKSFERLRDQSDNIEISDSDEDIAIAQKIPIITTTAAETDEPDASVTSPSLSEAANIISNTTVDEPAICGDSLTLDANTFSNRSQLSFDEILKIEESFDEDGANGILNQSIIVDIHTEPTIELRIHESDSDPTLPISNSMHAVKLTKDIEAERERCYSEGDAIDHDDDDDDYENDIENSERLVQSDSEILSKTPLELVVECDINENVIVSETKPGEITDLDHNHNDIVKSTENDKPDQNETEQSKTNGETELVQNRESTPIVQPNEQRRESISSRSNCSESDGSEPVYATVDTALNTVSYSRLK